ncbi:MAG: histidine kinase [Myxococcota bacterium]
MGHIAKRKSEMFVVPRFGTDVWLSFIAISAILTLFFYFQSDADEHSPFFQSALGTYLSCLMCCGASVLVWRHVLPRIVYRRLDMTPWMILHVATAAIVSAAVAWMAAPIMFWIHPDMGPSATRYAIVSGTIGVLFSTPMTLVFRIRSERRRIQAQLAEERQRRLEAQLHALQARTSPHFLFNTLNSIASLIPSDPDLAERTLERMSSLFRYSLESGAISAVPLQRELEAIEDYLSIQKTRFSGRFQWTLDVDPRVERVTVPPLFLQPLVENAVVHGVSRRLSGGEIRVTIASEGANRLTCVIEDNGSSVVGKHTGGSGTAVNDLRQRLEIRYGERASLDTERLESGGFRAVVTLPLDAAA